MMKILFVLWKFQMKKKIVSGTPPGIVGMEAMIGGETGALAGAVATVGLVGLVGAEEPRRSLLHLQPRTSHRSQSTPSRNRSQDIKIQSGLQNPGERQSA